MMNGNEATTQNNETELDNFYEAVSKAEEKDVTSLLGVYAKHENEAVKDQADTYLEHLDKGTSEKDIIQMAKKEHEARQLPATTIEKHTEAGIRHRAKDGQTISTYELKTVKTEPVKVEPKNITDIKDLTSLSMKDIPALAANLVMGDPEIEKITTRVRELPDPAEIEPGLSLYTLKDEDLFPSADLKEKLETHRAVEYRIVNADKGPKLLNDTYYRVGYQKHTSLPEGSMSPHYSMLRESVQSLGMDEQALGNQLDVSAEMGRFSNGYHYNTDLTFTPQNDKYALTLGNSGMYENKDGLKTNMNVSTFAYDSNHEETSNNWGAEYRFAVAKGDSPENFTLINQSHALTGEYISQTFGKYDNMHIESSLTLYANKNNLPCAGSAPGARVSDGVGGCDPWALGGELHTTLMAEFGGDGLQDLGVSVDLSYDEELGVQGGVSVQSTINRSQETQTAPKL